MNTVDNMFGIVCAGRQVQTLLEQVDENKFALQIPNGSKVNHMVVFLLPGAIEAIPPNMSAAVYFKLPEKDDFELLGALSQSKPSAIFRLNAKSQASVPIDNDMDSMMDDGAVVEKYDIAIGISIEPSQQVESQLNSKNSTALVKQQAAAPDAQGVETLANKIVSHAYNYLSGFTGPDNKVSMKVFDDWWNKFKTKLQTNPKFLDALD